MGLDVIHAADEHTRETRMQTMIRCGAVRRVALGSWTLKTWIKTAIIISVRRSVTCTGHTDDIREATFTTVSIHTDLAHIRSN